ERGAPHGHGAAGRPANSGRPGLAQPVQCHAGVQGWAAASEGRRANRWCLRRTSKAREVVQLRQSTQTRQLGPARISATFDHGVAQVQAVSQAPRRCGWAHPPPDFRCERKELTFRAAWLDSGLPFSRQICLVYDDVLAKAPTLHALLEHLAEVFGVRPDFPCDEDDNCGEDV
ncbi:unnamed protein product, partial [Symbiodinium sp. KB8]